MKAFLGAYLEPGGVRDCWRLTSHAATLADLPDDRVIFVDSLDELRAIFDGRHGVTPTGLRHTHVSCSYGVTDDVLEVYPHPVYAGHDFAELLHHLQVSKVSIYCLQAHCFSTRIGTDVVIRDNVARLDPKYAAKRRAREQARRKRRAPAGADLNDLGRELFSVLTQEIYMPYSYCSGVSPERMADSVLALVSLFNQTFGKNAHRRLESFHKLCADCRDRPQMYLATFHPSRFGYWLAQEAARKTLPAVRGDDDWKIASVAADVVVPRDPPTPAEPKHICRGRSS